MRGKSTPSKMGRSLVWFPVLGGGVSAGLASVSVVIELLGSAASAMTAEVDVDIVSLDWADEELVVVVVWDI